MSAFRGGTQTGSRALLERHGGGRVALPSNYVPEVAAKRRGKAETLVSGQNHSVVTRFTRDEAAARAHSIAAIGGTVEEPKNG